MEESVKLRIRRKRDVCDAGTPTVQRLGETSSCSMYVHRGKMFRILERLRALVRSNHVRTVNLYSNTHFEVLSSFIAHVIHFNDFCPLIA